MAKEFIEVISEQTKAQIDAIMPLVRELANEIKTINGYKASSTPSGADKGIKGMTDAYKERAVVLTGIQAQIEKMAKFQANTVQSLTAKEIAYSKIIEKGYKDRENASIASEKKETQAKISEIKARLSMIASLNKQRYSEEAKTASDSEKAMLHKYKEELKQIKAKQAMIYSLGKQQQQEEAQNAKWSRTGASSVIPGMAGKISDLKETEKTVLANEKLSRAYVQLTANREKAKQKLQDLIASERASNAEIRKAQKEFDVLNKKVAAADKAVGRFSDANRKINGLASSVGNLMAAFGVSTGLYLFVDVVKGIYETTKALQSMDLALKMVSETPLEFAKNQQFVTEVSEKWGLEIKSLQKTYTQFYTASKGLLTDDSIKTTFEGIAKAGSIMGLSLEQQQAAFYAIDQMMSKGTVTAEELKKQLGNAMPGAIKAAAMAYMELHPQIKSIQEAEKGLYADMKKGAIDSATYVPLIAKNFQILYGIEALNSVHTMQAAQNRLQNSWTEWIRGISQGGTGMKIMVSLMESLADNLNGIITTLVIGTTGWLAYKSAVMLANVQTRLLALTTTTATVATAEQTVVTGFQTAAQVANATATTAATTAWQRFTLALKANALGLAILAIGAAVVIFNHFNKSIEETTAEIKEANNAFITNREVVTETIIENEKLIKRYKELRQKITLTKEEQKEYNEILANLSKKVPDAISGVNNYGVAISLNTKVLEKYNKELQKQLDNEKIIALSKDKALIPELQQNVLEKRQALAELYRFKKGGALKVGQQDINVAIAKADTERSIAENELTMTAARIKSMVSMTEAEKTKVAETKKIKEEEIKNVEWYDKKIADLEKTKGGFTKRGEGLEYQKQLKKLQKERAYILGEEEKANKGDIKTEKDRLKAIEEANKLEYDLKMSNLERDKEIIADELKNEKDSLEYKQTLTDLYGLKEIQIAQAVYDEKIRLAKGNDALEQIALNEKNTAIENAYAESLAKQQKIKEDYLKSEKDKTSEWYKNNPPFFMQSDAQKAALDSENQKIEDWHKENYKARIKIFNDFVGEFANNSGFGQSFSFFSELDKNGKTMWEKLIQDAEDGKAELNDIFMGVSTIAQDAMNLADQADEQRFQRRLERLQKEKEVALSFAGDSDAAKKKIEEDYEKRKIVLEQKEFKRKQKMALANIAIDTAQAIMGIWAQVPKFDFGVSAGLMTAFVGGLGLVQAGMVMSQKPPEYWTGTDNAEAGLAWTNERGPEIVTNKHGHIKDFGDDKGARLTMMEKGDKVFNAEQTKKLMFNNELNSIMMDNGISGAPQIVVNSGMTKAEMREVMMETLGGQPKVVHNVDKNGFHTYIEKNGNITKRAESRGSGMGLTF